MQPKGKNESCGIKINLKIHIRNCLLHILLANIY